MGLYNLMGLVEDNYRVVLAVLVVLVVVLLVAVVALSAKNGNEGMASDPAGFLTGSRKNTFNTRFSQNAIDPQVSGNRASIDCAGGSDSFFGGASNSPAFWGPNPEITRYSENRRAAVVAENNAGAAGAPSSTLLAQNMKEGMFGKKRESLFGKGRENLTMETLYNLNRREGMQDRNAAITAGPNTPGWALNEENSREILNYGA